MSNKHATNLRHSPVKSKSQKNIACSIQKQVFPIPRKKSKLKSPPVHVPDKINVISERLKKNEKNIINDSGTGKIINQKYEFYKREINPEFNPEKIIPLRSCQLQVNAEKINRVFHYTNTPKHLVTLRVPRSVDTGSGEIIYADYQTDDIKTIKHNKIKTINRYCDFYEPLFRSRKVSLLFHTFSRADYSKTDMRRMLDNIKYRYKIINREILGYLWAVEFAPNENMINGFHIHYHLIVAIKRIQVTEIPEALKFNDLWGQRTGVEFIKKSVRNYLSKYLYKGEGKILGRRNYSISRNLLMP